MLSNGAKLQRRIREKLAAPELPLEIPAQGAPRIKDHGRTYDAICYLRIARGYTVYREGNAHRVIYARSYGRKHRVTFATDDQLRDFARSQGWPSG